jgi:hypothetical protein
MKGRPTADEAEPYFFRYIDRVEGEDVLAVLRSQLEQALPFLGRISEEQSLHRYEPGKWSIRQLLSHVTDGERLFTFRAFWFARGFESALPSFDEKTAAAAANADAISWERHLDDFRAVRVSTLTFFENLAPEAWAKAGVASDMPFSVRALAFICAGHLAHHEAILKERYL